MSEFGRTFWGTFFTHFTKTFYYTFTTIVFIIGVIFTLSFILFLICTFGAMCIDASSVILMLFLTIVCFVLAALFYAIYWGLMEAARTPGFLDF